MAFFAFFAVKEDSFEIVDGEVRIFRELGYAVRVEGLLTLGALEG